MDPSHPAHSDYLISTNGLRAVPIEFSDEPLYESTRTDLLHRAYDSSQELCGFITSEDQTILEVRNVHEEPRKNFFMERSDIENQVDYIYNGLRQHILGIWHSHPNNYPWPSPRDIVGWPNQALCWRYFLVSRGDVTEWSLVRDT